MVRSRYIGSNRARENGNSATTKQDFIAHVTGGDWIHLASDIYEIYSGNVQQALIDLYNQMIGLGNVITLGTPWSIDTNPGSIPMFAQTNNIEPSPLRISYDGGYSGLMFSADAAYPLISQDSADYPGGAPYFLIQAQSNLNSSFSGPGGEMWLSSGHNLSTSANWGTLRLISGDAPIDLDTAILQFNSSVTNPVITQGQINTSGRANDLHITSQENRSISGSPGDLWLESGTSLNGQRGNLYLNSWPGVVDVIASSLLFDKAYSAVISQGDNDTPTGTNMYVRAQSITNGAPHYPSGIPGNLWIESGYNPNTNVAGNIYLNTSPKGGISFMGSIISNIIFDASDTDPTIFQDTTNIASGQTFIIQAQNSATGRGGDLDLISGFSVGSGGDGNVNINANLGHINFYGGAVQIKETTAIPSTASSGVYLYVNNGILFSKGSDAVLTRLSGGSVIFNPLGDSSIIAQPSAINYTLSNTSGYTHLHDTASNFVNASWGGIRIGDIIRGNVYFKVNVTAGTILLNVRIYEDTVDVADFTIQVAANALEYVTIPIYWKALSSPTVFGVQIWGSAGSSDNAVISQMFVSNNNWGDFEFIRI